MTPRHRAPRQRRAAAPGRSWHVPVALGVLAVLTATPGVHLFERWMAPTPAVLVSHGLAVGLLGFAVARWRSSRAQPSVPMTPPRRVD